MNTIYIHEANRLLQSAIHGGNYRNAIDATLQMLHHLIDAESHNVDALLDHELEAHEKWSWPVLDEQMEQIRCHFRAKIWAPVNAREWERKYGKPLFPVAPTPTPALPSGSTPTSPEPASALEGQGFNFKTEGEL